MVSIHAPRVGCDGNHQYLRVSDGRFNSRTPCGVRLSYYITWSSRIVFQFTHPVWGATGREYGTTSKDKVSIHAPRVGCDGNEGHSLREEWDVSIHAPRVGCDFKGAHIKPITGTFQFTHPVWGATSRSKTSSNLLASFNSRTPCGVRRSASWHLQHVGGFNSRTPCGVRPQTL